MAKKISQKWLLFIKYSASLSMFDVIFVQWNSLEEQLKLYVFI